MAKTLKALRVTPQPPDHFHCFFSWNDRKECWDLRELVGEDADGYLCTPSRMLGKKFKGCRHAANGWVRPDGTDAALGRATTSWSFQFGVQLRDVGVLEQLQGLSPMFCVDLKKVSTWYNFLPDGYSLVVKTAEAVREFFTNRKV